MNEEMMRNYEKPAIIDFGSIADHTFLLSVGGIPPKDWRVCDFDPKHGDYSCTP